jgi:hypothetical protein
VVCVLLAREHLPFIRDWCQHHVAQGWNIVLYENTGSVGTDRDDTPEFAGGGLQRSRRDKRGHHYGAWTAEFDDAQVLALLLREVAGLPVTVHAWQPRDTAGTIVHGQARAYAEFVAAYRTTYEWAAFIDADEYLRTGRGRDWDELIELAEQSECGAVRLEGLLFDARWTPEGRRSDRYLERGHGAQDGGVKCVARLDTIERIDVHWVQSRLPDTLHPRPGLYWFDHRNGTRPPQIPVERYQFSISDGESISPAELVAVPAVSLATTRRSTVTPPIAGNDPLAQLLALLRGTDLRTKDWGGIRRVAEAHALAPAVWAAGLDRGLWDDTSDGDRSEHPAGWAQNAYERERQTATTLSAGVARMAMTLAAYEVEHAVLAGPRSQVSERQAAALTPRPPVLVVAGHHDRPARATLADLGWQVADHNRSRSADEPTSQFVLNVPNAGTPALTPAPAQALWPLDPQDVLRDRPAPTPTTVAAITLGAAEAGEPPPLRTMWEITVLAGSPAGAAIDWAAISAAFRRVNARVLLHRRLALARELLNADVPPPSADRRSALVIPKVVRSELENRPTRSMDPARLAESTNLIKRSPGLQFAQDASATDPFAAFDAIFCLTPASACERWRTMLRRLSQLGIESRTEPIETCDGRSGYASAWREAIGLATQRRCDRVLVLDHEAVFLDDAVAVLRSAVAELGDHQWDLLLLGAAVFGQQFPAAAGSRTLQVCGPVVGTFAIAVHARAFTQLLNEIPPAGAALDDWIEREIALSQYLAKALADQRLRGLIVSPRVASQLALLRYADGDLRLADQYTIR